MEKMRKKSSLFINKTCSLYMVELIFIEEENIFIGKEERSLYHFLVLDQYKHNSNIFFLVLLINGNSTIPECWEWISPELILSIFPFVLSLQILLFSRQAFALFLFFFFIILTHEYFSIDF